MRLTWRVGSCRGVAGEVVAVFWSNGLGIFYGVLFVVWLLLSGGVGALGPRWKGKCYPSR
jgi:hypothetical protein